MFTDKFWILELLNGHPLRQVVASQDELHRLTGGQKTPVVFTAHAAGGWKLTAFGEVFFENFVEEVGVEARARNSKVFASCLMTV